MRVRGCNWTAINVNDWKKLVNYLVAQCYQRRGRSWLDTWLPSTQGYWNSLRPLPTFYTRHARPHIPAVWTNLPNDMTCELQWRQITSINFAKDRETNRLKSLSQDIIILLVIERPKSSTTVFVFKNMYHTLINTLILGLIRGNCEPINTCGVNCSTI